MEVSPRNAIAGWLYALLLSGATAEARYSLNAFRDRFPLDEGALVTMAFLTAFAEGDLSEMHVALDQLDGMPEYPGYAALLYRLQGNRPARQEIVSLLTNSTGYVPHRVHSLVAMSDGRIDAALNHWREGLRANEPLALLYATGGLPMWRETFPEFYDHPDYQQMLVQLGLDDESRSKITVPELPF